MTWLKYQICRCYYQTQGGLSLYTVYIYILGTTVKYGGLIIKYQQECEVHMLSNKNWRCTLWESNPIKWEGLQSLNDCGHCMVKFQFAAPATVYMFLHAQVQGKRQFSITATLASQKLSPNAK